MIAYSYRDEEQEEKVIWEVVYVMFVEDTEKRQFCPVEVNEIGLVVHETIVQQRDGYKGKDCSECIDGTLPFRSQSPGPDTHQ